MSTVYETAALLPDPPQLRAHLRALAVLDATIGDDPRFSQYTFDNTWSPGVEAALMENGSGDDFSVLFTPAGVLIRGFDHESAMSPYGTDDEQVWPGVIDDVPATLRPMLDEPAFRDEGIDTPRVTACLWRETCDTAWRTGPTIPFPAGSEDPDGSGFLFHLLTDRSPEAVQAHFEDYYERPVPLDAIRHVLAGRPLTPAIARALNPAALSDSALLRRIAAHPEVSSYLSRDGEFDLARTDPIESIALPNGLPVEPVAGCNAGGTHYLCGPAVPAGPRPVLYTDSEGRASLIAECLAEALTLTIVLPPWHDALAGFRPPALNADYLDNHPDHPAVRDRLLAALRLPAATDREVLDRLRTTAARTVPDGFLPHVPDEEESAFEPMLERSTE
ncbi:hypothetical protein ACFZBM_07080 [Streptomyces lavendulae]|uniref:Uncharacterized protein n=1 Tax=Streptomyces lavendulae subsp. lavendulae TaxID=58340 RepID=A0A2K8PDZ9_STRLA|nr:hypothetical protein [Streptomyces lavendulae]ATZ24698.1 hypothetical protein SLAV_14210 [Streptomyces lavendulae subsp. lavendulae]QUQ54528.1 hypothetical protein SLLC_12280 [Streptomyces lavendulae subsp. lavendulae]